MAGFVEMLKGRKKQIDEAAGDNEPVSKPTTTEEKPASSDELDTKMEAYKKKYGGFQKTGK